MRWQMKNGISSTAVANRAAATARFPSLFLPSNRGRRTRRTKSVGRVPKNAIVTLNELRPGLKYDLVETRGPVHLPIFVLRVSVNGQSFFGEGRSKKAAKHEAASAALASFVQFKDVCGTSRAIKGPFSPGGAGFQTDFTNDCSYDYSGAGFLNFDDKGEVKGIKEEVRTRQEAETKEEGNESCGPPLAKRIKLTTPEETSTSSNATGPPAAPGPSSPNQALQQGPKTTDKNPVMLLNELRPGLVYAVKEKEMAPGNKGFIHTVTIDGTAFEGTGASKKLAKQACARTALTKLYGMTFTPLGGILGQPGARSDASGEQVMMVPGTRVSVSDFSLPQSIADRIGQAVTAKFSSLMEGHAQHTRRKVLAGIVMTTQEDMDDIEVISVSTGTKCINGEHMSMHGNALNDCHAEIVSRRCLCEFLYQQLEILVRGNQLQKDKEQEKAKEKHSIFESRPDGNGYKLKENYPGHGAVERKEAMTQKGYFTYYFPGKEFVRFHLYINTAPCGDARIFSPHEPGTGAATAISPKGGIVNQDALIDRHPQRKARGQLRTKIESGEGTIPVKSADGIQTWDAVLQGSRLLTMSCSDKLARWNVIGVQGALLSHLVEPIYLYSISLGSLFHPHHLYRALAGRIEDTISGLPPPYRLNVPRLNLLSSPEVRQPGKAPNYSVNWTVGCSEPEIIDAIKGKEQEKGNPSRLAKASFFSRWLRLVSGGKVSPITSGLVESGKVLRPDVFQYGTAKNIAVDFQAAKEELFNAFNKADLGKWVKKPMEQDEFHLER